MAVERSHIEDIIKSNFLFKKTDDTQLNLIVDSLETSVFEEGEIIFEEGNSPSKLFIVLDGKVLVTREDKMGQEPLGLLESGDVFGFEMLEYDLPCLTTTTAKEKTTLFWFDREKTWILLQNIATLNLDLKTLFESYRLGIKTRAEWRAPEEVIYFISRRHIINLVLRFIPLLLFALITLPLLLIFGVRNNPGMATPLLLLGGDILALILWSIWNYADWANDYSILTNQRILFLEKIVMLYDSRVEAPLHAILSISTETDWLGRVFSYGDVIVRTYAGSIILSKISNPRQVSTLIEVQLAREKSSKEKTEYEELDDLIRSNILLTREKPEVIDDDKPIQPRVKKNVLQSRLANFLKLRIEQGGVIIYRTHWFVLLRRIFFPSLLLIGIGFVIVARIMGTFTLLSLTTLSGILILFGLFVGGWLVYIFIDWRNDHYVITPDQIVDVNKKPLGKEERRAAPLKNVLSIEFERLGIIGLILNFGTVYINVGEATLTFDYVFNPAEVQRELFRRLETRDYADKQEAKKSTEKFVVDWISAYHRVREEDRKSGKHEPYPRDEN